MYKQINKWKISICIIYFSIFIYFHISSYAKCKKKENKTVSCCLKNLGLFDQLMVSDFDLSLQIWSKFRQWIFEERLSVFQSQSFAARFLTFRFRDLSELPCTRCYAGEIRSVLHHSLVRMIMLHQSLSNNQQVKKTEQRDHIVAAFIRRNRRHSCNPC